jgi:hypothetical protein
MVPEAGPMPRRARRLVPAGFPYRTELIAAGFVLILLVHLLLAQLALVLAVAFAAAGKLTGWRRCWLLGPAVVGLGWMLAVGPGEALEGFAAGPSSVLGHLAGAHAAGRLARPFTAFSGIGDWLPRQFPVALPLAAGEAALIGWLGWLHTDEWAVPPPRPGAVAALRATWTAGRIRSGGVLTRNGVALGIAPSTGAVAELAWAEISRGVLVAGSDAREVALTCLQLVHAALRRRKPVIVLAGADDTAVAHALAAACLATGTPLRHDGAGPPLPGRAVASRGAASASKLWGRGAAPGDQAPGEVGRDGPPVEPSGLELDLGLVVSERLAALVPVESAESAGRAASRLTALGAELRGIGADGDGLVWVPRGERLPAPMLAALVRDGAAAGLPVLIGTASPAAAGDLAGVVGSLLVHRVTDRDLADALAGRTGTRLLPAAVAAARAGQPAPESAEQGAVLIPFPVIEARALLSLRSAEFVLVTAAPRRRVVAHGRLVPARLPRHEDQGRQP